MTNVTSLKLFYVPDVNDLVYIVGIVFIILLEFKGFLNFKVFSLKDSVHD
jgi:hypothetical protein